MQRTWVAPIFIALAGALASTNVLADEYPDPFEGLNKELYKLTKFADSLYVKPAATAYEIVVPPVARYSIRNFFNNMNDYAVVVNDLLLGKIAQAASDTLRVAVNTTFGVFGLFDIATEIGLPHHNEDLGKTFYNWGWKESSFFVIPFFGPSTFRDAWGLLGDIFLTPPQYFQPAWRTRYYVLEYIDRRSDFSEIEGVAGVAGVNYYSLVRSTYFQHRYYVLTDGQVPIQDQSVGLGEPPP